VLSLRAAALEFALPVETGAGIGSDEAAEYNACYSQLCPVGPRLVVTFVFWSRREGRLSTKSGGKATGLMPLGGVMLPNLFRRSIVFCLFVVPSASCPSSRTLDSDAGSGPSGGRPLGQKGAFRVVQEARGQPENC